MNENEMRLGLTLDAFTSSAVVGSAMNALATRPLVRLVFDQGMEPEDYYHDVERISRSSEVLACVVDSSWSARISGRAYVSRFERYFKKLRAFVWQWEIGNEINGPWCARDIADRVKQTQTYIHSQGGKTHLCFYGEPELFAFIDRFDLDQLHTAPDSVGISYYEQDNDDEPYTWEYALKRLAEIYKNSDLYVSECGTSRKAKKVQLLSHYYGTLMPALAKSVARFRGGGFWWYGRQDFVPKTKPLYPELKRLSSLYDPRTE